MTLAIEFDGLWGSLFQLKPAQSETIGDLVRLNGRWGIVIGVFDNPETARDWVDNANSEKEAA